MHQDEDLSESITQSLQSASDHKPTGPIFLTYSQMQTVINQEPVFPEEETISYQVPTRSVSSNAATNISGVKMPNISGEKSVYVTQSQIPLPQQSILSEDLAYSISQANSKMPLIDEVSGEDLSHCDSQINQQMDTFLTKLENRIKNYTENEIALQEPHFNLEGMSIQQSRIVSGKDSPSMIDSGSLKVQNKPNRHHTVSVTSSPVDSQPLLEQLRNDWVIELSKELQNKVGHISSQNSILDQLRFESDQAKQKIRDLTQDLQESKLNKIEQNVAQELQNNVYRREKQTFEKLLEKQSSSQKQQVEKLQRQLGKCNSDANKQKQKVDQLENKLAVLAKDNKSLVDQLSKKVLRIQSLEQQLKIEKEQGEKWRMQQLSQSHLTQKNQNLQSSFESCKGSERHDDAAIKHLIFKMKQENSSLQRTTENLMSIQQELESKHHVSTPKGIQRKEPIHNYFSSNESSLSQTSLQRNTEKKQPVSSYLGRIPIVQSVAYRQQQQQQPSGKVIPATFHQPIQYNIVQFPPYQYNIVAENRSPQKRMF